jgi:hypothetical protein
MSQSSNFSRGGLCIATEWLSLVFFDVPTCWGLAQYGSIAD